MIGAPSITVAEAEQQLKIGLARRFVEGGERYYSLTTGEVVSDVPKGMLNQAPETDRPALYKE